MEVLVQHLSLLQADSELCKEQLSDEFLDGFRACEETPKVGVTAVCSETDVDAIWQVLFLPQGK